MNTSLALSFSGWDIMYYIQAFYYYTDHNDRHIDLIAYSSNEKKNILNSMQVSVITTGLQFSLD